MWADGSTMREIAAALDSTPGSISQSMIRMREQGWDLPKRSGYPRRGAAA